MLDPIFHFIYVLKNYFENNRLLKAWHKEHDKYLKSVTFCPRSGRRINWSIRVNQVGLFDPRTGTNSGEKKVVCNWYVDDNEACVECVHVYDQKAHLVVNSTIETELLKFVEIQMAKRVSANNPKNDMNLN